jgi:cytochrome c55X
VIRARPVLFAAVLNLIAPLAVPSADAADEATPDAARQRELIVLLRQDCGSCHGMRLTGGLGPALTADALKDRPPESVVATIVHGRPGTPMPPWQRFVSQAEAEWLAAQLIGGRLDAR